MTALLTLLHELPSPSDRFDGRKVLPKAGGKRPGKKCGKSYIAAERQCKSHKSGGKLTAEGRRSATDLAQRIRAARGMNPLPAKNAIAKFPGRVSPKAESLASQVRGRLTELKRLGGQANEAIEVNKAIDELRSTAKTTKDRLPDQLRSQTTKIKEQRKSSLERKLKGRVSNIEAKIADSKRRVYETGDRKVKMPKGSTQADFSAAMSALLAEDKAAIKKFTIPKKKKSKKNKPRK